MAFSLDYTVKCPEALKKPIACCRNWKLSARIPKVFAPRKVHHYIHFSRFTKVVFWVSCLSSKRDKKKQNTNVSFSHTAIVQDSFRIISLAYCRLQEENGRGVGYNFCYSFFLIPDLKVTLRLALWNKVKLLEVCSNMKLLFSMLQTIKPEFQTLYLIGLRRGMGDKNLHLQVIL